MARTIIPILSLMFIVACGVSTAPPKSPTSTKNGPSNACSYAHCGGNGPRLTGLRSSAKTVKVQSITLPSGNTVYVR